MQRGLEEHESQMRCIELNELFPVNAGCKGLRRAGFIHVKVILSDTTCLNQPEIEDALAVFRSSVC